MKFFIEKKVGSITFHSSTQSKIISLTFPAWILFLQTNNIFDEEYDTYMENFTDQNTGIMTREGYPGAGRSIFFNATYEY